MAAAFEAVETDVIVIGAGPTGLAVACLLADRKLRVLVVEKNSSISDEPRAISITDESLRVMQQIGIMDALAPEMLMDTGARYYGRNGQMLAEVRAAKPRLGHPAKSQFDQPVLAGLLLGAAKSRDSVDIRFNAEAFGIASYPTHVDAVVMDAQGKVNIRAKWVIACDGGRSPIRSQLGIPLEGSTQPQKWIVVDTLNSTREPEKFSQFYCNVKRPAVIVPGVKGRVRFEFMLLPGEDTAHVTTPEFIIKLVAPYQAIEAKDIRRAAVYVAQQRIALTFRAGRVLLAGDAAHLMPPFAGQGLNAGIRDAANLAWKVADHVHGIGTEALIDSYQAERRPHASEMVRLSYRIGKVVMTRRPAMAAARDYLVHALGVVPPAKRWLVGMKFLKQPHFESGCVCPPDPQTPTAAAQFVGRALPQPSVDVGQTTPVGLDSLLGNGWALIRFPRDQGMVVQRLELPGAADYSSPEITVPLVGAFEALRHSGLTLWVRPDHYVAAVSSTQNESVVAGHLGRYVSDLPARLVGAKVHRAGPAIEPREVHA